MANLNLPPFFDMEWFCDHAISERRCKNCRKRFWICSDVSGDNDMIDSTIEMKCEFCGCTNIVTVAGKFEKAVQKND